MTPVLVRYNKQLWIIWPNGRKRQARKSDYKSGFLVWTGKETIFGRIEE